MTKHFFFLIALLPVFGLHAQTEISSMATSPQTSTLNNEEDPKGIQFTTGNWAAILQEAKSKNKLVFLDAYTTWCGPCKLMSKDVFTDEKVGKFYNARFVNAKINMEEGEGVDLAKKFSIKAYPSLLFFDGDGNMVHRIAGFQTAEQFLELGRIAMNPIIRLSGMEKRYENGDRNPDFLQALALLKYEAMDGTHTDIVNAYMETQEDWSTEENMRFLFNFTETVDSKLFDYLVDNRLAFEEKFGAPTVQSKIQNLILSKAFSDHKDETLALNKMDQLFSRVFGDDAAQISAAFRMNYFQYKGDMESFSKAAVHYMTTYPSMNPVELNNTAWAFYESVNDKEMLGLALDWALKSVELDSQYYNNDTVAALYYKLGKKGKAKKTARKAIEMAKANGEDFTSSQTLLSKIAKK